MGAVPTIPPVHRITVLAELQDLDPSPAGASWVIPETSNSKHFFYDVQGFKYDMLTKDRGHERADKLKFITRAANADNRLPYLYSRSMNYSAADIISVIRNEHDEDQHQRSIYSDLHLWLQVKGFLAVSVDKKLESALRMQFSIWWLFSIPDQQNIISYQLRLLKILLLAAINVNLKK